MLWHFSGLVFFGLGHSSGNDICFHPHPNWLNLHLTYEDRMNRLPGLASARCVLASENQQVVYVKLGAIAIACHSYIILYGACSYVFHAELRQRT